MYIEAAVERCVRSGRAKSGRISLRERRSRLFVVALGLLASASSAAAASAASPIDRARVAPSATPCSSAAMVVPAHGPARSLACRRRSSSSPLAARPPPLSGCARGQSARAQLLDEVSESPWISLVASLGSVDLGARPSFSLSPSPTSPASSSSFLSRARHVAPVLADGTARTRRRGACTSTLLSSTADCG